MAASSLSLSTTFDPAAHGFHFDNSDIQWQLPVPFLPLRFNNLCGGMIYAALDYFYNALTIPAAKKPPPVGSPLNDYIFDRQAAAHVRTIPRLAGESIANLFTSIWYDDALSDEFDTIRKSIAAGRPAPLFMVGTGVMTGHHVLVIGCQPRSDVNPILEVYDPNSPDEVSVMFTDRNSKRFDIFVRTATGSGWRNPYGHRWRGFFVDTNYAVHKPTVVGPVPGPAPGPSSRPLTPRPPAPTPPPSGLPPPLPAGVTPRAPIYYAARAIDSLELIAARHYGDEAEWRKIYAANAGEMHFDPQELHAQQLLKLPV